MPQLSGLGRCVLASQESGVVDDFQVVSRKEWNIILVYIFFPSSLLTPSKMMHMFSEAGIHEDLVNRCLTRRIFGYSRDALGHPVRNVGALILLGASRESTIDFYRDCIRLFPTHSQ